MQTIRDQIFLTDRLQDISIKYFPEIDLDMIDIAFGRRARTRLGSIRPKSQKSIITINGLFRENYIPKQVIDLTIAHELCHFVHGFSSVLPQLFAYPHQGGAVTKELNRRGLGKLLTYQKSWLKTAWPSIIKANFKPTRHRRRSRRGILYLLTH